MNAKIDVMTITLVLFGMGTLITGTLQMIMA